MEKTMNIAKNTSYLTFALVLQKIISFTYFTILARNLGPENLGKYYFAISFATVFAIFIDIGMINVLTREVAKRKDKAQELLGSVIAIKLPLVGITTFGVLLSVSLGGYESLVSRLIYISLVCVVLDSFTTTFWAVARGFHNLLYESVGAVLFQIIVMSVGLIFLFKGFGLIYLMAALLSGSLFHFIYSYAVLAKRFKVGIRPRFKPALMRRLLLITVPFGLFAVFQRVYMYLDSVLLGTLAGNEYVGYYQISFKIIFALQFLPMAFIASLYPAMSDFWQNNKQQLKITFEKAIIYLMLISIPISAGVVVLADKIILIFREGYGQAVLPMRIIIFSVLFVFINFPIGSLLNACDRPKKNTANMIIATITSIIINLILIPKYQAVGASITVLATNAFMAILGLYWANRLIRFNKARILIAFTKISASATIMGIAVYMAKEVVNIFFLIPLGVLIYFALISASGTISRDEVKHISSSFLKR